MPLISKLNPVSVSASTANALGQNIFSPEKIKQLSVIDSNSSRESDDAVVKILSDKNYSSDSVKRKNEIFQLESTIESGGFKMFETLSNITARMTDLIVQFSKTERSDQKEAISKEVESLANEFNTIIEGKTFKELNTFSTDLASRDLLKGQTLNSQGTIKALTNNQGLLGANFINQAEKQNISYFRNLTQNLEVLNGISIKIGASNKSIELLTNRDLVGISSNDALETIRQISSLVDNAFNSFLKDSVLTSSLSESIKDFQELGDKVKKDEEEGSIDLAGSIRAQILTGSLNAGQSHSLLAPIAVLKATI